MDNIISKNPTVTERRRVRESPHPHFRRVAKMWSAIIGYSISPEKVVLCMAALKIARECGAHEPDNVKDAIGYLDLLAEVRAERDPLEEPGPEPPRLERAEPRYEQPMHPPSPRAG